MILKIYWISTVLLRLIRMLFPLTVARSLHSKALQILCRLWDKRFATALEGYASDSVDGKPTILMKGT